MYTDRLQLTSPGEEEAAHFGIPRLEIVNELEEDVYPQRTSHDSDYELSDTPYSSQNVGSKSQPLELSPENTIYDSVPKATGST